jgi:hypothetical protein
MIARICFSRHEPKPVEQNRPEIGSNIGKPSVGSIAFVFRIAIILVTCYLKIYTWIEPWKWISKPHDISILEKEMKKLDGRKMEQIWLNLFIIIRNQKGLSIP